LICTVYSYFRIEEMEVITVEKTATLSGHKDCVYALCPSQYSNIFFSAGGDGLVVSWNLEEPENGVLVAQVPNSIYALCYDVVTLW